MYMVENGTEKNVWRSTMSMRSMIKDGTYRLITLLLGDDEELVTLPILSGPARGLRIRADLIKRKDAYFWGKYDRQLLKQVLPLIQPGWTVWDCGTYIGFYTLLFAKKVGPTGRVVAIELDLRNLRRTRENASINGLNNIEFINAAIGAPDGEVPFIADEHTNSHLLGTHVGGANMKDVWEAEDLKKTRGFVECMSFDQSVRERGLAQPNLIKIDIEGSEKDALQHGDYMFEQVRPLLILELHNPDCDRVAWEFARRFRYDLQSLDTGKNVNSAEEVGGTLLCRPRANGF